MESSGMFFLFFAIQTINSFFKGSAFQHGYALGVMNTLIDDLENIFDEKGTSIEMNFTAGIFKIFSINQSSLS